MSGIWDGAGGAAVQGGLGLIGSLISGHQQRKENQRNRDWQREMYDISVQNNREDATSAFQRQMELTNQQARLSLANEQTIEQNRFQNLSKSAKDAGVNMGLALAGGAGGNAAGGVATPTAPKAEAGHAPMPNSAPIPPVQMAVDLSAVALNKALANKANEEAKTEDELREKKGNLMEADYQRAMAAAEQSQEIIKKYAAETSLLETKNNWEKLQLRIGQATEGEAIESVKQELENLKKAYREMVSRIRLNNAHTVGARIQNTHMHKYWGALVKNIGAHTELLSSQTNNEEWKGLMNEIAYDIAEATKAWDIRRAQALTEEQEAWERKFNLQKRGQNIELAGEITRGVIDMTGLILTKGASKFGVGQSQKTIKYEWNGRGFTPKSATKKYFD